MRNAVTGRTRPLNPYANPLPSPSVGELNRWLIGGTPAEHQRATIILERQRGVTINTIAARLRIHRDTVRRWLARYRREGASGLSHRNAGHAPCRIFGDAARAAIRAAACAPPATLGCAYRVWSLAKLRCTGKVCE